VAAGVDAETIDAHLDESAVLFAQILIGSGIFGVQIDAIAGNLGPPAGVVVPVELAEMVPQIVGIVIDAVGVFHLGEARRILCRSGEREVVVGQSAAVAFGIGHHASVDGGLVGVPIAREQFAEILFAEIAGVVDDDVEQDFHAASVGGVDDGLEINVFALISVVHLADVAGVIAVVVVAGGVLHDGRNPNGGESERFDVVHLLDETFEVAAPARVAVVGRLIVPALRIIGGVAIVEAGGDGEVNHLVAKVRAILKRAERLRDRGHAEAVHQHRKQ